jgi:hypothetical protein
MIMIVVVAFGFVHRPDERKFHKQERECPYPKSVEEVPVHRLRQILFIFCHKVFFGMMNPICGGRRSEASRDATIYKAMKPRSINIGFMVVY